MENKSTEYLCYTGKAGAIEAELAMIKAANIYLDLSEEGIEKRCEERKIQLEKELEDGLYQISSNIEDAFIKKID